MILDRQLSLTSKDVEILLKTAPTKKYYESIKRGKAMKDVLTSKEQTPRWITDLVNNQTVSD
jgi:hypothetical protein